MILLSDRLCIIITVSDDLFYVIVLILHKCVILTVQEAQGLSLKKTKKTMCSYIVHVVISPKIINWPGVSPRGLRPSGLTWWALKSA